mmetsp:Transcript_20358/g.64001  ORF Transcript_20358/g.64001 Transcript_20358/m.64001 type:complete len:665 (+) Transcript_20358:408-2402(+)
MLAPVVESTLEPTMPQAYLGSAPGNLPAALAGHGSWPTELKRWAGRPPPLVLQVVSPNEQAACSGEYTLCSGEEANGSPLWQKRDGGRWLYSGVDGKWYVGGPLSRRYDFQCASGFLCCGQVHGGRMPDSIAGAWEVGNGSSWRQDRDIVVTALIAAPAHREQEAVDGLAEDYPGVYIITHKEAAVTSKVCLAPPILAHLDAGMVVHVVEVVHCPRERRVRGRIERPAGWISLVSLEDGYRWARRVEACGQEAVAVCDAKKKLLSMDGVPGAKLLLADGQEPSECSTDQGSSSGLADDKPPSSSGPGPPSSHGGTPPESLCDQPSEASEASVSVPSVPSSQATAPSSPAVAPPQALHVATPNGQLICAGEYRLVPEMMPNGMPLWKQRDGEHWVYSGKAHRWCIGGQDVVGRQFATNAGWIYQGREHGGLLPHRSHGSPWMRWNGRSFEADHDIVVTQLEAHQKQGSSSKKAPGWKTEAALLSRPEDRFHTSALDVVLECLYAGEVNITLALGLRERCMCQRLEAGVPWIVGPRHQPQVSNCLACAVAAGSSEDLLALCWRPPGLYLQRPSPHTLLLLNGQVLQSQSALVEHDSQVSASGAQRALPVLTFRVLSSFAVVHSLQGALQAAQAPGSSILDLRGSRLSGEERRALCTAKEAALRIVI